jgi:hypothetical protein
MEGRGQLYLAAALLQDDPLVPIGQEAGGGGGRAGLDAVENIKSLTMPQPGIKV